MLRSITLLTLGALLGGVLMLGLIGVGDRSAVLPESRSLLDSIASLAGSERQSAGAAVSVSETLAVYRAAAAETDVAAIRAALERIAAEPWSPARKVEIDALLVRLSDLDPATAAGLARTLGLETYFVADAYLSWARSDPQSAIDALAAIQGRAERLEVALTLLDAVGGNVAGLERVAAGLPDGERSMLALESIVARAGYEPYAALRDALALYDTDLQRRALTAVAVAWAAQDPRGAIAQAEQLPEELKSTYRISVINEWARLDGADFLGWLASSPVLPSEAVAGIDVLAGADIDTLFSIADGMTGEQRQSMRFAALGAFAERDPEAAMARAAAIPPGPDRDMLLMSVGSTVARTDPDAALAWARELTPPSRNLVNQITIAIVQSDPVRAIPFMENPPAGVDPQLVSSVLGSTISRDPDQAEILANTLVARDSIQAANALRNVVGSWMQQDPERALEWVLANDAALDAAVIGPAAQSMARADPVAAASYVSRIPVEYRSAWITQVAGPFGMRDPNAALAWVAQFQGQDVYESALRQIISASVRSDARAAARILSQSGPAVQLGAATQVAQALAQEDPRGAAQWAVSLSEPRAQRNAVATSISAWAVRDTGAARNFALSLDRGETRDQALNALVVSLSQSGEFDRSLLDAMSADSARQEALASAIPQIARNDREAAEDLLRLVTSGESRRAIEERIQAIN